MPAAAFVLFLATLYERIAPAHVDLMLSLEHVSQVCTRPITRNGEQKALPRERRAGGAENKT